jgi:hypothetical protein
MKFSLTNTTQGFTQSLEMYLNEVAPYAYGTNLNMIDWEVAYSNGTQCITGGFTATLIIECQSVTSGRSCTIDGYAVLRNYYSPATPSGESDIVAGDTLQLGFKNFNGVAGTYSGPGIQTGGPGASFDLAGLPPNPNGGEGLPTS